MIKNVAMIFMAAVLFSCTPEVKVEVVPSPQPTLTQAEVTAEPQHLHVDLLGVHTVKPKDTLWGISGLWYNDYVLWPAIYQINKGQIKDPDLIYTGQKFDIPKLSGTDLSTLSDGDKSLLSEGYLEAYRVYKDKGRADAEDYHKSGEDLINK